jgi:hypothetical protein
LDDQKITSLIPCPGAGNKYTRKLVVDFRWSSLHGRDDESVGTAESKSKDLVLLGSGLYRRWRGKVCAFEAEGGEVLW